jgi:hypothetical protein
MAIAFDTDDFLTAELLKGISLILIVVAMKRLQPKGVL